MDDDQLNSEKEQAQIRRGACILADAWLALWKAEELHTLDLHNLEITVRQCCVSLVGTVPDERQSQLAECLLKAISGVNAVHNELEIDAG